MKLNTPFLISARLLPALKVADAFISIEYAGDAGGRQRYRYHIDTPSFEHTGDDLDWAFCFVPNVR